MFQIKNSVLYYFLLVLEVPFNITSDAVYKLGRVSKAFPQKDLKFILHKEFSIVTFEINVMLVSVEVRYFSKIYGGKKDAFVVFSPNNLEIIFAILTKIKVLYVQVFKYNSKFLALKGLSNAFSQFSLIKKVKFGP